MNFLLRVSQLVSATHLERTRACVSAARPGASQPAAIPADAGRRGRAQAWMRASSPTMQPTAAVAGAPMSVNWQGCKVSNRAAAVKAASQSQVKTSVCRVCGYSEEQRFEFLIYADLPEHMHSEEPKKKRTDSSEHQRPTRRLASSLPECVIESFTRPFVGKSSPPSNEPCRRWVGTARWSTQRRTRQSTRD